MSEWVSERERERKQEREIEWERERQREGEWGREMQRELELEGQREDVGSEMRRERQREKYTYLENCRCVSMRQSVSSQEPKFVPKSISYCRREYI